MNEGRDEKSEERKKKMLGGGSFYLNEGKGNFVEAGEHRKKQGSEMGEGARENFWEPRNILSNEIG